MVACPGRKCTSVRELCSRIPPCGEMRACNSSESQARVTESVSMTLQTRRAEFRHVYRSRLWIKDGSCHRSGYYGPPRCHPLCPPHRVAPFARRLPSGLRHEHSKRWRPILARNGNPCYNHRIQRRGRLAARFCGAWRLGSYRGLASPTTTPLPASAPMPGGHSSWTTPSQRCTSPVGSSSAREGQGFHA
jgi:hypothetical protein